MAAKKREVSAEMIAAFDMGHHVGIEAFAGALWAKAFAAGYERGKADERDAIAIDAELAADANGWNLPAGEEETDLE